MLVPHRSRRSAHHLAVIERCRQPPEALIRQGIPVAPVAKCLVDASRRESLLDVVQELVAECIQERKCSVADLRREVLRAARQRSGLSRLALVEIEAGVRSVAEARIRRAVIASSLPIPLFNPSLFTRGGDFIACPDGYFPHCAAGWEVDSFAYHFRRGSYLRTQRRLRRTVIKGVLLIGISPVDAIEDPAAFVDELRGLIDMAAQRQLPDIVVRPADAAA